MITVEGVADDGLVRQLLDGLAELTSEARSVVLDLDDLLLTDVHAVRAMLADLLAFPAAADRLVVSCRRLSGRRILRRLGGEALRLTDDRLTALSLAVSGSRPLAAAD